MNRRDFLKCAASAPLFAATLPAAAGPASLTGEAQTDGSSHPLAGSTLPKWNPGEFQIHFIYTGVAESQLWIMPDGTTMLIDCGDHPAWTRGKKAVWILPNGKRTSAEWIARYVARVNPAGTTVDYLMLSHHHADHAGMEGWGAGTREWNGEKLSVSGFLQAADTLKFKVAFDRGWPNFDEPIPNELCDKTSYTHIRKALAYLAQRDGTELRRFEVGAVNQVAMVNNASAAPGFTIVNITGNGRILCRGGGVRDLYAHARNAKWLNENAMSLGLAVKYGAFKYYTAGDFYDTPKLSDGRRMNIEEELAAELGPVDVAKVNHHGHHSMSARLVATLRARVWTACTWDQLHMTADTLARLSDRESYPGPRLVAPGVFPPQRRLEDAGKPFMADIAPESFAAGPVVVTVAPGGASYNVAYVTADDESMKVTGAYDFAARG